jgi:hypothetical protein
METVRTSETSNLNETLRHHIPEGCYLRTCRREELKSQKAEFLCIDQEIKEIKAAVTEVLSWVSVLVKLGYVARNLSTRRQSASTSDRPMISFAARKIDNKMLIFLEFPGSNAVGTPTIINKIISDYPLILYVLRFIDR